MNKSVLMIMGGALAVAIVVALMVQAKLSPKSANSGGATIEILVAKKKMMTGDLLTPEQVRWQAWPEASLFKGVIKKSDQPDETKLEVYDTPLRRNIEPGEPVTMQAIIADIKGGNNFLAAAISPGMRAVGISVKANTAAGGFVLPGDHVDVMLSYVPKLPRGADQYADQVIQRYASQTILKNVKVLAVDQKSEEAADEKGAAKIAKTVTLEVSAKGAQVLALADRMGTMSLALRRIGEKDSANDKENTLIVTDATTSEVLRRLNDMKSKTKTNSETVKMYNGASIQNVPVTVVTEAPPRAAGE